MNLAGPFLEVLRKRGQQPAIIEPSGEHVTYAELLRQIEGFAEDLRQRGFQPGDGVVIQVPNGVSFAVATVASLALGGVVVLSEPGLGDEVYLERLEAARPKWVFVHPVVKWANRIPGARRLLRRMELLVPPLMPNRAGLHSLDVSNGFLLSVSKSSGLEPIPREAGDDAILIFTGGTTNQPKGVRLSHGALHHYLRNIESVIEGWPIETFLADTPQQVLYGLQLGRTVYVTKGRTRRRAAYVMEQIRRERIDAYFGSPFLWMEMMARWRERGERLPQSLRAVLLGGAPVTRGFLRELQTWLHPDTRVLASYGLTEAGPVCVATAEDKIAWNQGGDYVGRPLSGVRLQIDSTPAGDGVGEVIVHSNALYTGYMDQPERGADAGLRTGDLGRLINDDPASPALVLVGREKDMIIRAGVNVYPGTVEGYLREIELQPGHLALRECALVGLWDPAKQDEVIVFCYQPVAGRRVDEGALRKAVEKITGEDAAPDFYLRVDPIPVTGRQNKIDKRALRERAAQVFSLKPAVPSARS